MRNLWRRACALAVLSLAGAAHAAKPPDVLDFVRRPDFTQVSISPDGKYLAALAPTPDQPHQNRLVIFDAATAKPLRLLNSGRYQLIGSYVWAGANRLIGSIVIQRDGLDAPLRTGELYAINAGGNRAINLFGFRASANSENGLGQKQKRDAFATVISTELDDPDHVLIATRRFSRERQGVFTDFERLNVLTGSTQRLGGSPVRNAELMADHSGTVRVAWAGGENLLTTRLWTRAGDQDTWHLVNDPSTSGVTLSPIGFNHDNSQLYVESAQGDAPNAIERMDMASGKRSKVYQGTFGDPLGMLPTADGKDYYAIVTADGRKGLHYLDPDSTEARLNATLAKSFPGRLAYFSSFSADGKRAIVRVESDRNSGDYYLMDMATRNARFLLSENARIDPRQMRAMQPVALKARDGLNLHGFITLPAGKGPFPTVVLVHGGPFGISTQWAFDPETQLFASRGYAVLQINYRGSGGYGAHFESRGYGHWATTLLDDVTDATRWAVAQGHADPARLCIYGASYGGYAAMEEVVRQPDLFRCAIGYAGVYDMRVQLEKSDTRQSDAGLKFLHETMGKNPAQLLADSPLSGVSRITADLLLIHGGEDPRAPFANFREFTRALDGQHKAYETLVEPDEGHGFFIEQHRLAAYTKMLDFLDRHFGSQARARPSSISKANAATP